MRILSVTQVYDPFLDRGGPAVKVRAIAERLAARGHAVTVLTTSLGPAQPPGVRRSEGVEAVYLRPVLRWRALSLDAGLARFCRRRVGQFDLVHIYGLYDVLGPAVAWSCRRRGIPYVVEPLGMARAIDRSFRLKRAWHALLAGAYLRGAARLVATSEQEQEELTADGFAPARVFLRYNGIELEAAARRPPRGTFRRQAGIGDQEPLVLFLGRLIPRKGADLLIAAFAQACPERGRLVIAGPESEVGYADHLRREAARHGVAARVLFPGPLYGAEKFAALADADVFALPSRYENFANTVAEAVACGTPVIVTPTCGISRLIEGRAGLVVPREVPALAAAIARLLGDAGLRERFRAACPAVAAGLSWDGLLGPMESLYRQLANGRARVNA